MSEDRMVKIGGTEYTMSFPTLGRVKQLGRLLKVDVLKNGIAKVDYSELFSDDDALNKVLELIFGDKIKPEAMLNDMSAGDLKFVILSFFLKAQMIHATTSNGLSGFVDSYNKAMLQTPPTVTASTLPSTEPATEDPKQ